MKKENATWSYPITPIPVTGDERRRFYQMGYDEAVQTIKRDLFDIAIKDKNENLLLTLVTYIKKL